jgi:hypothetical protein
MIIYYNPQTGEITDAIDNAKFVAQRTDPFIQTENIRISDWRVNLETLQLEAKEPEPVISRGFRAE